MSTHTDTKNETPATAPIGTPEQRMEAVLERAFHGLHHVQQLKKQPRFWECVANGGLATFDFNTLTLLVLAAHEHCVRVELSGKGRDILIRLHPRTGTNGRMPERHPSIEEALSQYRDLI